eukprot:3388378-Rhodomonas_salina.1
MRDVMAGAYLGLALVLGSLEEHVLEEMSAAVAVLRLIAAARVDEHTHRDRVARRGLRRHPHAVAQGRHLGGRELEQSRVDLIGRRKRAAVRLTELHCGKEQKALSTPQTAPKNRQVAAHPRQKAAGIELLLGRGGSHDAGEPLGNGPCSHPSCQGSKKIPRSRHPEDFSCNEGQHESKIRCLLLLGQASRRAAASRISHYQ